MSNLSRKIKRATEPHSEQSERAKKRFEGRLITAKNRPLFGTAMDNRIGALSHLEESDRASMTNDMGVVDLDAAKYQLTVKWRKNIGWFPEWLALTN